MNLYFQFVWTQFSISVALAATRITGTVTAVAWMYAVNSIITVALGYLLPRAMERWLSPLGLLIAGTGTIAAGLGLIAFADSLVVLLAAAGIFAVGAVLARPGEQTVTANLASPQARGTYFGVAASRWRSAAASGTPSAACSSISAARSTCRRCRGCSSS